MRENDRLYERVDFKDRRTVKQLLYYRAEFKKCNFTTSGSTYDKIQPNHSLYTDIIAIYADLDELIERADLTDKNRRLLKIVMSGYTVSYIYNNFENYNKRATISMFDRILEKINDAQREKEAEEDDD